MTPIRAFVVWLVFGVQAVLQAQTPAKPDTPKPDAVKQDTAKNTPKPITPPISADWQTKILDMQFADPERVRALFSGRSFVMEASRDLKTLTVHGSPAFIKEVEDTVKRFDVPPPPPANVQITVYLLTTAEQAPAGVAVPPELAAISKDFGAKPPKLADSQVLRVREGQSALVMGLDTKPEAASLSRVWLQSASVGPGRKGDLVSLYGLRVWLNIPSPAGSPATQLKADPDVAADVDIDSNQVVMVSKVGVEKPVAVVVRAVVIR